ncbi:guanine nucleotide-binding protein subunit alpha [Physocladia obscura]|uniref:Guanine nucleotide-binding protein subunit alpha n=1 Tax=Physocladia obscura TaxID=109957 RepID=A0AAD5XHU2_9FUNG|nr:guanine nucleotide-binding protein subunit alpha [Physocladia obscura]
MGTCASAESAAAAAASKDIDKQLKAEMKAIEQNIKLLLLGAGETGKSTVLKQIKLIHGTGYSDEDRAAYKVTVLTNVITSVKTLLHAMDTLKIPFGFDPTSATIEETRDNPLPPPSPFLTVEKMDDGDAQYHTSYCEESEDDIGVGGGGGGGSSCNRQKKEAVEGQLQHKDDSVARAAASAYKILLESETLHTGPVAQAAEVVNTSAIGVIAGKLIPKEVADAISVIWKDIGVQYCFRRFLNDLCRICNESFVPTDQDILNSRIMTTTITETRFKIEGIIFRVFDVGGQRSERKKWAPYFDDINAIIYLVAINSYDQICFEDNSTNRTDYFPTYEGPNDYDNGSEYFATRFLSLNKYEKKIYVHFTWATDTKQIKTVLAIVNQIILRSNLVEAGL